MKMCGKKTKFDYEIEDFSRAFKDKMDKKIVIYGTGRMTATLLGQLRGFCIVGLMDRDESLIGQELYGIKIVSVEEAEKIADIVIINTSETYWHTIYRRIEFIRVPVYFRNGELAVKQSRTEKEYDKYGDKSYDELQKIISEYDVVSFDVFDTVLMRKLCSPHDVFRLIEKKVRISTGDDLFNFLEVRKKAVSRLEYPDLDEIYLEMQKLAKWDEKLTNALKQCEWETDLQLITARKDMVKLCIKTMEEKEVYFVSDMYYTSEALQQMLIAVGLDIAKEKIYVSCEHKMSKETGELWEYYKRKIVGNRRALHIGDSLKSDYEIPKKYNIDTYFIRSANEMMEHSSMKKIVPAVASLYSSMAVGAIQARIFNSPFALQGKNGVLSFNDAKEAGYCLMGSLCYSFIYWLMKNAREDGIDKIFFFAREGYLLIEQYNYMSDLLSGVKVPKADYLEISRRAIVNAAVEKEEDIYETVSFPYMGNLKGFVKDRFGLKIDGLKMADSQMMELQRDDRKLQEGLAECKEKIYQKLSEERENYRAYLSGKVEVKAKIGVVDSLLYGNTQYYLGKVIKKRLQGYYFCVCLDEDNKCIQNQDMKGCFQKEDDKTGKDTQVWKNSNYVESFFTAPQGMLLCIDSKGKGQYAEKMTNQKRFDIRRQMQEGIFDYIKDILNMQKNIDFDEICHDELFADRLFGVFMEQGFEPSQEMKDSFYYDNGLLHHKEAPIWG